MNSSLYFIMPVLIVLFLLFRKRAKKEVAIPKDNDFIDRSTEAAPADDGVVDSHQIPDGIEDIDYNYDVVGESFRRDNLLALVRSHKAFDIGEIYGSAILELEPTNEFDPTAVKVVVEGVHVGYIPKFDSSAVTQMIKNSGKNEMQVPVRIGFDTDSPQPLIGVRLALTIE